MHILFGVHGYKPAYRVGGPILSVSALAERLVARGHQVTVFTTNANLDEELDVPVDQPIDVEGVSVWYFRRDEPLRRWLPFVPYLTRSMGFLYAPAMRAALDSLVPGVDIVHTHMPFVYPTMAVARAAIRHRKPLFYHQRGVFDPARLRFRGAKKRLYIRAIERPLMRNATRLIALTEAEVLSYQALGVDTPCTVIPNGIDVERYRTIERADVQARWGVPSTAIMVLFMGRLHPIKGADRLLDAFANVQARIPDACLVMAGPDEWGMQASFRARADAAGLQQRVIFPGMVEGEDKLDLLARADLFCLPSDAEGFSMAVLEALASSTAVLLSPGCYFPEVEAAGAGTIAPSDVASIAGGLVALASDRERLRAMGANGRQLVTEHYTWDRITDAMIVTYETGRARTRAEPLR